MPSFRRLIPKNNASRAWFGALTAVAIVLLVVPHPAHALDPGSSIALLIANILMIMVKFFASMTGIFVSLLIVVARYNTFLNAEVVVTGWPIVRDLMNMVFIIGLLIIAAGTVLRLQNYRYNRLLGKLIMMALLVNFSKFIAVFLLQFAQVIMLTFVNAFKDIAFGNFSHMFGLDAVLIFANEKYNSGLPDTGNGNFKIAITLLAGLVMMIVSFVVILAICVVLFTRIIALWLLIILSPMAYALRIIPNTEKYASQWWSEFGKYAVVGPVLAFFLWISLALVAAEPNCDTTASVESDSATCEKNPLTTQQGDNKDESFRVALGQADTDTDALRKDFLTEALSMNRMITFVVGIIFLIMGLNYAQKSGTAGAAFAGKVAAAGFGAASAVTGLNYLRDRTVAPVQGWMKNRAAARQSAITERTQTLEAAGDRARANLGRSRIGGVFSRRGTERAEASAAEYERTRTQRVGAERGFGNRSEQNLQQRMHTSGDERERTAAMMELQKRGRLGEMMSNPQTLAAFNYLTSAGGTGQRTVVGPGGTTQTTAGRMLMAEGDRRKLREDAVTAAGETANWPQAQTMLPGLTAPERAKLLQSMNNAGHLDLEDDIQHQALLDATNPALGLAGIKETDRRKIRLDALKTNVDHLSEADLRRMVATMTTGAGPVDNDELNTLYQALEKKDALNAERAPDRDIATRVRTSLAGNPQKLRQFEDDMKKNNANMAKAVIYNGFTNGMQSGQQVLSDIQAGLFAASNLTSSDLTALQRSLETDPRNRMSTDQAQNYLHNGILNGARSKEEYNRIMNSMDFDARHDAMANLGLNATTGVRGLDQTISRDKRDWVAAQGAFGEAYEGLANADQVITDYVNDNATTVKKNMLEGKVTEGTIRNLAAFRAAAAHAKIGRSGFDSMITENPDSRTAVFEAALNSHRDHNVRGTANTDNSTPAGLGQNTERDIGMAAGRGRTTVDPLSGLIRNSADDFYTVSVPSQQAGADVQRQSFFTRQGGTLLQLDETTLSPQAHRDAVLSLSPNALEQIADRNTPLAQRLANEKRAKVEEARLFRESENAAGRTPTKAQVAAAVTPLYGHALTVDELDRLESHVSTLRRSLKGI